MCSSVSVGLRSSWHWLLILPFFFCWFGLAGLRPLHLLLLFSLVSAEFLCYGACRDCSFRWLVVPSSGWLPPSGCLDLAGVLQDRITENDVRRTSDGCPMDAQRTSDGSPYGRPYRHLYRRPTDVRTDVRRTRRTSVRTSALTFDGRPYRRPYGRPIDGRPDV